MIFKENKDFTPDMLDTMSGLACFYCGNGNTEEFAIYYNGNNNVGFAVCNKCVGSMQGLIRDYVNYISYNYNIEEVHVLNGLANYIKETNIKHKKFKKK